MQSVKECAGAGSSQRENQSIILVNNQQINKFLSNRDRRSKCCNFEVRSMCMLFFLLCRLGSFALRSRARACIHESSRPHTIVRMGIPGAGRALKFLSQEVVIVEEKCYVRL